MLICSMLKMFNAKATHCTVLCHYGYIPQKKKSFIDPYSSQLDQLKLILSTFKIIMCIELCIINYELCIDLCVYWNYRSSILVFAFSTRRGGLCWSLGSRLERLDLYRVDSNLHT